MSRLKTFNQFEVGLIESFLQDNKIPFEKWCLHIIESYIYSFVDDLTEPVSDTNYTGIYRFEHRFGDSINLLDYELKKNNFSYIRTTNGYNSPTDKFTTKNGTGYVLSYKLHLPYLYSSNESHLYHMFIQNLDKYNVEITTINFENDVKEGKSKTYKVTNPIIIKNFFDISSPFELNLSTVVKECNYNNGQLSGLCKEFNDGRLKKRSWYTNGKLSGFQVCYYNNLPSNIQLRLLNGENGLFKQAIHFLQRNSSNTPRQELQILNFLLKKDLRNIKCLTIYKNGLKFGYELKVNYKKIEQFSGSMLSNLPEEERIQIVLNRYKQSTCQYSNYTRCFLDGVMFFERPY